MSSPLEGSEQPTERIPQVRPTEPTPTREMPVYREHLDSPQAVPELPAAQNVPTAVRILSAIAGLLSAGLLLLGIALLVLKFLVPSVRDATGLDQSYGPGTGQIIVHLVVGAAGEGTRLLRRTAASPAARGAVAAAVIVVALAALWWSWWS